MVLPRRISLHETAGLFLDWLLLEQSGIHVEFLYKGYEVFEFLFRAVVLLIEGNAFLRSEDFDESGEEFVLRLRFGCGSVCLVRVDFGRFC